MVDSAVISENIELQFEQLNSEQAETLVLINTLGSDFHIWDRLAGALTEFRVVRYNLRGQGVSSCPSGPYTIDDHISDLSSLLDYLKIDQATLIGCSAGGLIAMGLAAREPSRVRRLVLSNADHRIGNADAWNNRIEKVRSSGRACIVDDVMERWFSPPYRNNNPARMAEWRNMLLNSPLEGYLGTCAAIRDADMLYDARAISQPTLCIAGSDDLATSKQQVSKLAEQIPGARYALIAEAGHFPCIEQHRGMAELIMEFVRDSATGHRTDSRPGNPEKQLVKPDSQRVPKYPSVQQTWRSLWSGQRSNQIDGSLKAIAMLAAAGHEDEIAMHIRASCNTGASRMDIQNLLSQVAVYAGPSAARAATRAAMQVLSEVHIEQPRGRQPITAAMSLGGYPAPVAV